MAGLVAKDDHGKFFCRTHFDLTAVASAVSSVREPTEAVLIVDAQAICIMVRGTGDGDVRGGELLDNEGRKALFAVDLSVVHEGTLARYHSRPSLIGREIAC